MKKIIGQYKAFWVFILLSYFLSTSVFARTPLAFQEKSIPVMGHSIFYNDVGQGTPIVLIHGLFANKEQWHHLIPSLDRHYRVIAPDLPGYGKSLGFPFKDYDLNVQVAVLHHFLTKLGIKHFHIAGSSMGGAIAALYTKQYPEEIISLTFIGSPLGVKSPKPSETNLLFAQGKNPFLPTNKHSVELLLHLLFVNPPDLNNEKIEALIQDNKKNYALKNKISKEVMEPFRNIFSKLTICKPSLIMWGLEDRIFDKSGAKILHEALPHSELVYLKGTGHLPQVECAPTTAEVYLGFLGSVENKKQRKIITKEVVCG